MAKANIVTSISLPTRRHYTRRRGWTTSLPSETIPGQSMTVSEILDKFTAGLGIPQVAGEYFDDDEMPDPTRMSRLEYLDAVRDLRHELALRMEAAGKESLPEEQYEEPHDHPGNTGSGLGSSADKATEDA